MNDERRMKLEVHEKTLELVAAQLRILLLEEQADLAAFAGLPNELWIPENQVEDLAWSIEKLLSAAAGVAKTRIGYC